MLRRHCAAALLLIASTVLLGAAPAYAGDTDSPFNPGTGHNGEIDYSNTHTTPGSPGSGGSNANAGSGSSGTPAPPSCDLGEVSGATWCMGTRACFTKPTLPPLLLATGPKPQPDSQSMTDWCGMPAGISGTISPVRTYWSDSGDPPAPPLAAQAEEAAGKLNLALLAVRTSPVDRTLVTVPTWYWVTGAEPTRTGSSAFGLVAIATIKTLTISTGDGDTISCPWTISPEDAAADCQHVYTHASYDGTESWQGRPAYAVSATATWDIHFELNGVRIQIPGAPTTLTGDPTSAVLRVDEVQTLVTDAR